MTAKEVIEIGGRPRKVVDISTGKIGKKKRINRKIQEEKLRLERDQLENGAPAWLSPFAAEEYMRVVQEAGKVNLLDNLDLAVLAIYADNYDRYIDASRALQCQGLIVMGKHEEKPSPYIKIANDTAVQIQRCSTKLGLAATDRLKLIVPTQAEEKPVNKFLRFLERG
ncbi:MAG: phage terminase small subunit P27 family [Mitsuokella sp.]